MKITDVRTASVGGNFEWILVRVYTDEGLVGLGECYWGAGVETIVRRDLVRLVEGEDPHDVDWLYHKMIRGMSGAGSTAGAAVAAISGVELALWDLKGQALGTPIYNLLGGRHRPVAEHAHAGQHGHGRQPHRLGARVHAQERQRHERHRLQPLGFRRKDLGQQPQRRLDHPEHQPTAGGFRHDHRVQRLNGLPSTFGPTGDQPPRALRGGLLCVCPPNPNRVAVWAWVHSDGFG